MECCPNSEKTRERERKQVNRLPRTELFVSGWRRKREEGEEEEGGGRYGMCGLRRVVGPTSLS